MRKDVVNNLGDYAIKGLITGKLSPSYGRKMSMETRNKIRNANLGRKKSKESIQKRREKMRGNKHSEETKRKISIANKGKKRTKEQIERHSKCMKNLFKQEIIKQNKTCFQKGHSPWNKGKKGYKLNRINKKKLTDEEKKRIREYTKKAMNRPEVKFKLSKISRKNAKEGKNPTIFRNGKEHPNWKGGKSFEPYDKTFNDLFKRRIRKRDNQVCMLCGIHREKLKRALPVHHINYDKLISIKENCISLCPSCHMKTNENRKYWIKFFQLLFSEKYGYHYNELNEPIINIVIK